MPNGYGKPIGFASRTLTNAEKTVLPVGRALACVHGVNIQILFAEPPFHIADRPRATVDTLRWE